MAPRKSQRFNRKQTGATPRSHVPSQPSQVQGVQNAYVADHGTATTANYSTVRGGTRYSHAPSRVQNVDSGKKRARHEEISNSEDEEEVEDVNCPTSTTPIPATASRGSSRQPTPVKIMR